MKKKNLLVVSVFLMVLILSGCQTAKPEDTIYKLEEAMNNYDMEMMLECYEPSVQKIYAGAMEIGSSIAGMDLDTILNAAGGLADLFGDELVEGGMPQVDIIINSQEQISEDKLLMNLTVTYDYGGLMEQIETETTQTEETFDAYLVLINGIWYLSAETPMMEW